MFGQVSIAAFAASALLAMRVTASPIAETANTTGVEARSSEWQFNVYEQGSCPENPTGAFADYAYSAPEGCQNFGFAAASCIWSGSGFKVNIYQSTDCSDSTYEQLDSSDVGCYGTAVLDGGSSTAQSFKVISA